MKVYIKTQNSHDQAKVSLGQLFVKRKGLYFRFFILLVLSLVAYGSFNYLRPVKAVWYDDSYLYREKITFGNTGGSDTNKKVKFDIDTATLIAANKMQSDCDDVRFTDLNGMNLKFYLDAAGGACNTSSTDFYVLFPTILTGTNTLYMYYGNSLAISATQSVQFAESTFAPTSGPSIGSEELGLSPVLYWKMEEGYGSSTQDSLTSNNDGTISGATWKSEDMCEFGKCLSFDGSNDYVSKTYSSDTELNPGTDSFTISSWFKHTSSQSGTDTLIARADGVNGVGYKVYMDSSGYICFGIDASAGSFPSDSACSTTSYADSRWHQITGVKSTTASITLYIDGVQIAQDASITASSISGSSSPFYAGIDADGTSNPWTGFIDEVKVYPYARTAAQIKTDVLNTSSVKGVSTQLGGATQDSLSKGLIGYWKMDETSDGSVQVDRTDSSGNAITLTDNNTTASGVGRFSNGADLEVSNSEHLKTASGLDISSGDQFTVSAWIKRESEGSEMTIINMGSSTQSGVYTFMTGIVRASSNYIYAYMGNQLVGQSANSVISTGTWYQVVWVYNGSGNSNNDRLKLYLNGQLQAITHANTVPSTLTANGTRWCVGCYYSNASGDYFDGIIDEARIYNRALNGNEIQQLYNFAPGPVNYWKFDEKTGVSAYDSTGNGFTGTLTSSPTWTNGKFGGGLSYNNGPYVTAGDISSADWSGLSVGAWVYWDGTTHGGYEGIYNKNSSGDLGRFLISSTGQVLIQNGNGSFFSNAAGDVPSNVWSYLSYVYDQNAGKEYIYVNGVQKGSQARSGNITQNANDFLIGWGHINNTAYTFSGKIDDVKVYNYARTPKQVLEDMNGSHPAGGSPIASQTSYWKFDEGQGTSANDISPNSNTMTLSTATSAWTNAGKYGKAWDGNGSRYVSRADDSDFDVAATDDYAVSLWYKSDSASNPGATEYIINKANATNAGYAVYANTSGQICFAIDDDTSWTPDIASCTTTDYYDATWHHIFAVRDATTTDKTYIYIDGKLQDSDSDSTTATLANSLSLYLADRDGTDNGDEFTGDLDEVKVYRTALTQNEILVDYNSGSSITLGATSNNSTYEKSAANQEYCVPGDTTSCASPIGEWHLDEKSGSSTYDKSGNNLTGVTVATWTTGKKGASLSFVTTSDVVTIADDPIFDVTDFTIEAWIYPTSLSGSTRVFCRRSNGTNNACEYSIGTSDDEVTVVFNSLGLTATSTSADLVVNNWYHIVGTFSDSGNVVNLYVNGKFQNSTTINGSLSVSNSTVTINRDNTSRQYYGKIDLVQLYNYVRTPAQVAWDYNRGKAVAMYKFDECSGTSAYDTSGNSFTGTITPTSLGNTTTGSCNSGVSTEMWNDGTNGKLNSSLGFDGTDDYVVISDTSSLRFDSSAADFSLFAWVKRTTTGTEYIISKEDADNDGWRLQFNSSNQVLCSEDATDVTSTATITDTNWHHIGCTIDRDGNGQVYIDGSPSGSAVAMGTDAMATTANITIGTRSYTATNYFNGLIDDVQIFGYALTSSQIKLLLNDSSSVRFGPSSGQP